jgi:hypothetical protein
MRDYLKAMGAHLGEAAEDVLFVAVVSITPLLFGRIVLVFGRRSDGSYWDFLYNGQMAFYSMGSLAAILLLCFRKKLPDRVTMLVGLAAILALFFLMVLVGIDPTLNAASFCFVGWAALILYVAVQVTRILVEAMRRVGAPDALCHDVHGGHLRASGEATRS